MSQAMNINVVPSNSDVNVSPSNLNVIDLLLQSHVVVDAIKKENEENNNSNATKTRRNKKRELMPTGSKIVELQEYASKKAKHNSNDNPVSTDSGMDYNARYAEGLLTGVIGSLINSENRLMKAQSNAMAEFELTTMNSAIRQSTTTQVLGVVEGIANFAQAGVSFGGIGANALSAKELKRLKDEFNFGNAPLERKLANINSKMKNFDTQLQGLDTELKDIDQKIEKLNGPSLKPTDPKVDPTKINKELNNSKEIENLLKKKEDVLKQKENILKESEFYTHRQKALMNKQDMLKMKYEHDSRIEEKNLAATNQLIQGVNAIGSGVTRISNSSSSSIQAIEQAKQSTSSTAQKEIENSRDSGVSTIQGLAGVNMYASSADLGRA